jgi:hypothetical protein
VAAEDLPGAAGPVVALAALVAGAQRRLIVVHQASPALVWDLRCGPAPLAPARVAPVRHTARGPAARILRRPPTPRRALRCQCVVVTATGHAEGADAAGAAADAATAAAWVGARGECFATGHASGAVRVWSVPATVLGARARRCLPSGIVLGDRMRPAGRGAASAVPDLSRAAAP